MGVLLNLTKEYFGAVERDEDKIEGVNRVSFTDGNGRLHKKGYQPESRLCLDRLMKILIERRGYEGDFNDVDTSLITDMSSLFMNSKFNGDISGWKFPKVKYMNSMFRDAADFNQPIGKWKFPEVTDMSSMFNGATAFNQDIGNWKFPVVIYMGGMFEGAASFNQPIGNWRFPEVVYMHRMFKGATSFDQDISGWNIESVTYTINMFKDCPIKDEHKPKKFRE